MAILVVPFTREDVVLRRVFFPLYGAGVLSCLGLMGVFWLGKVRRHATIYSLLISVVLNGIFNLVQLAISPSNPSKPLCVLIAATNLAFTASNTGTAMGLVFRTWSIVVFTFQRTPRMIAAIDLLCLLVPWTASFYILIGVAVACSIKSDNLVVYGIALTPRRQIDTRAPGAVSLVFLALSLFFELWTILAVLHRPLLFAIRTALPTSRFQENRVPHPRRSPFDLPFTVRVLVYGLYIGVGLGCILTTFFIPSYIPSMYQSTAGCSAALVFGSQRDVLEYLHNIRTRASDDLPPPPATSPTRPNDTPGTRRPSNLEENPREREEALLNSDGSILEENDEEKHGGVVEAGEGPGEGVLVEVGQVSVKKTLDDG